MELAPLTTLIPRHLRHLLHPVPPYTVKRTIQPKPRQRRSGKIVIHAEGMDVVNTVAAQVSTHTTKVTAVVYATAKAPVWDATEREDSLIKLEKETTNV